MTQITQPVTDSLAETFRLLLLLTANLDAAEAALLHGIETSDPYRWSGETLTMAAVERALQHDVRNSDEAGTARCIATLFSPELRGLFQLPAQPRRSFALRFLARLPLATCRRLLRADDDELDRWLRHAIETLATQQAEDAGRLEPFSSYKTIPVEWAVSCAMEAVSDGAS